MCFVLSVSPFVFVHSHKRQLINIDLQDCSVAVAVRGLSEEMINRTSNVEMSGRTRLGHTHAQAHTCSFDWEKTDRSQPDLSIALRKRSIKQQVHFSAEAFKNMAAIALRELC